MAEESHWVRYDEGVTAEYTLDETWLVPTVWIEAGSSIANLEMDSNQVIANGNAIIYAFQRDGYAGVWDNSGAGAKWVKSTQPCNVSN
jgi:hypothetical protein